MIVGNWKMNLDLAEAFVLSGQVAKQVESIKGVDTVLCPPALFIYPINDYLKAKPSNFFLGLQNTMSQDEGAYTGEVSLSMTKNLVRFVIIGHSERRRFFGETDEMVSQKVKYALDRKVTPILCVGEKERFNLEEYYQYEVKRMKEAGGILSQIKAGLKHVKKDQLKEIVIAYEPVWAIGGGNAATGAYAAAICYIIKNYLEQNFGDLADEVRILYGGSVSTKNVREFMMQPSIHGLLVGGESLKAKEFVEIVQTSAEVKNGR